MRRARALAASLCGSPGLALAADGGRNDSAIVMFSLFIAGTLLITWWAARRTRSTADFYAAGSRIGPLQNGLAITGDFLSAATFLGISGLTFLAGFDGLLFIIGGTLGWSVVLFLIAERLRNLGRYTFADAVAARLERAPIRVLAASGTLVTVIPYLLAQIVGAGALIQALFGTSYAAAVVLVGVLMTLYVSFGGMIATTWVQTIKAALLLIGGTILAIGVMRAVDFDFGLLVAQSVEVHKAGGAIMRPGLLYDDPITVVSLALAFVFGTPGLPHVLMRFFTVRDATQARRSVALATGLIGYFMGLIFIIGLGAIVLLTGQTDFLDADGRLIGGNNMAAIHLAQVVGGDYFLGFISAVAFATILAVVSGLTLSAASAVSHDLYANVIRHGRTTQRAELTVSRLTTVAIGLLTIGLGILFERQNVAVLATFAIAIAASVNFPVLILTMYWRRITTRGAIAGGYLGLVTAVALSVLGPAVWVDVLGFERPIYPYTYPTLFSVGVSFIAAWWFSVTDRSARARAEAERFDGQLVQAELGPVQR